MAKQTDNAPKAQPSNDTLSKVLKDFKDSWDYCASSWHQRWQDNFALYNNNRVKRGYEGITDTFVPMAFSTVETLTSALFGTKPKFNYLPPAEMQDQKTDILNSLLDFYWDKDQWSVKVINWGRSMLQVGTGVVYLYWDIDHPCMVNIPIRDFFFDPTATTMENMRFMGRRYLTTKEQLKTYEVIDPETGEMRPRYRNLDKVTKEGGTGDNTDKQQKDMWYGTTTVENDDQIEVIEHWTNDRVVSVANRTTIIEDSENWFKAKDKQNGSEYPSGIMPFAVLRDYTDESLFLAKGEIDVIADEQELLNDITNQNIDSITFTLNQMYTLDPKYAHLINEIENLPGAIYPVEAGTLNPIQQRPIPPDAFNERMNIKNEIRETTASNEVIKGAGQQEGGNATATEINAQIAGAGQRVNLKVTQIENEGFHRLARIVFEMVKRYVTEPMMVRILGDDGARWEEFDPEQFQGEYEPRVLLDITIENKNQEQAAQAKEMLAAFLQDPEVNQQELKKIVLRRGFQLDPDEVEALMTPNPMAMGGVDPMTGMPMDPMADPMMGGMPPEMMGMMGGEAPLPPMEEDDTPRPSLNVPVPEEDLYL